MDVDVEKANDEGADPSTDIRKQNPGGSTTADQTEADSAATTKSAGSDGKSGEGSG